MAHGLGSAGEFAVGQAVVLVRDGERRVGQIAGMREVAGSALFEVSLEDVVEKGVWAEELEPATPAAIQATLAGLALDEQLSHETPGGLLNRDALRRAVLRQEYVEFLRGALQQLVGGEALLSDTGNARFAVGDAVAFRDEGAWTYAEVRRITSACGGLSYAVEAMGEVVLVAEDGLAFLEKVPCLGTRARLRAPGHELDDDFVGTICRVEATEAGRRYALLFDDGDILTDLVDADLDFGL